MQQRGGVKAFLGTPVGKGIVVGLALLALVGSFLYLGPFLAIPTFLLFGIAVPVWTGWRKARDLAIIGLVVLLVAAPVISALYAQEIRTPSPVAASDNFPPYGFNGSILSNAQATPFLGAPGASYNFSVVVNPDYRPAGASPLLWVTLYLSTCPGATGNDSPSCSAGYPFYESNLTLPASLAGPTTEVFALPVGGPQIWWWTMGTAYYIGANNTTLVQVFLDPSSGFGAVQGPVTGDYGSTFGLIFPALTEALLLEVGILYFFALAVYLFWRSRRARNAPRPSPPAGTPPEVGPSTSLPPAAPVEERKCPNCQALVYPNETSCWKCGAPLTTPPPAAAAPLPSSK